MSPFRLPPKPVKLKLSQLGDREKLLKAKQEEARKEKEKVNSFFDSLYQDAKHIKLQKKEAQELEEKRLREEKERKERE